MHAKPGLLQFLIDEYPEATSKPNANGDLPLHVYLRSGRFSNEHRHMEFRAIKVGKREKAQQWVRDKISLSRAPQNTNIDDRRSDAKVRRSALKHSASAAHLHRESLEQLRSEHKRKEVQSKHQRMLRLFSSDSNGDDDDETKEEEDEKAHGQIGVDNEVGDDFSEFRIDEEVVLTLIQSNPNAVKRRCDVSRQAQSFAFAAGARKLSLSKRDKRILKHQTSMKGKFTRGSVVAEEGLEQEGNPQKGDLPLEIYIGNTPAQLISSKVLSLLMGCIDMESLFDIETRPHDDDDLVSLSVSEDRYDLENWVAEFLVHGLTGDQLRALALTDQWGLLGDQSKNNLTGYGLVSRLKALMAAEHSQSSVLETPERPQCVTELSMSGVEMEVASAVTLYLVESCNVFSWTALLDRYGNPKLLRSVLEKCNHTKLHPDDIALLCKHVSMMKLSRTIFDAHTAYLLTCVPISSPTQYGLSASEGIILQARIFSALTEYSGKQSKATLAYFTMMEIIADYICEFAMDEKILSEVLQSGANRQSVEQLTTSKIVQAALT